MNIFPISTKVGRKIQCAGQAHLHFSGTAYLGMGSLPEFENMVVEGIHQYGPNYGASRGNNVRLTVYEEMESFFAEKAEAENALVMSSGFLAGYLTAAVLSDMAGEIWVAPDTHPAILPQGIKRDNFTGFGQFAERCVEESHRFSGRTVAIFANALDPLTPAIHSYNWVRELSQKNTYYLLLDDSHAFGLIGKGIYGTYAQWKDLPLHLVISGSLGKALGIPAGVVLGPASFMEKIASNPIFIGASPPAPGPCKAFLAAQGLYETQQRTLQKNMAFFFSRLQGFPGIRYLDNFPVATFHHTGWAQQLMAKNILISSFPYPSPDDAPLDRIVLSAHHENEDLLELIRRLEQIQAYQ